MKLYKFPHTAHNTVDMSVYKRCGAYISTIIQPNSALHHFRLLDSVPTESTLVPLILGCMLEQVVATVNASAAKQSSDPFGANGSVKSVVDAALSVAAGTSVFKTAQGSLAPMINPGV